MESEILAVLIDDRQSYDNIKDTLSEDDFTDLAQIILKQIVSYYNKDPDASHVDREVLTQKLTRKYPNHKDMLLSAMENIVPVSIPNVMSEYVDLRIESMARRISNMMSSGVPSKETNLLLEEYQYLVEKREESFTEATASEVLINEDFEKIFEDLKPENLMKVYPKSVNDALEGGVPKGSHIVVFGRPNSAKSLFGINLAANSVKNSLTVLYVGNEDPQSVMVSRVVNNLAGMTRIEILADMQEARDRADAEGYSNLIFAPMSPGSVSDVRRLALKHQPDIVIVDQLRNLSTSKNLSKVEKLDQVAQGLRNIGKETGAVMISITQAGDSAEGKLVLEMGDIDFSNTAIQAAADLIIGIGCDDNFKAQKRRMLTFCKSKFTDDGISIPVKINPSLSRIEDI